MKEFRNLDTRVLHRKIFRNLTPEPRLIQPLGSRVRKMALEDSFNEELS